MDSMASSTMSMPISVPTGKATPSKSDACHQIISNRNLTWYVEENDGRADFKQSLSDALVHLDTAAIVVAHDVVVKVEPDLTLAAGGGHLTMGFCLLLESGVRDET